ncbi:MAG: metal-sulfur cluster assembly factor [Planctomycetota bacterium]|jgi:metal-sulfur cluster biosynthetic enzyme
MPIIQDSVYAALRQVYDPEFPVNIVDLGLIYEVAVAEAEGKSNVHVKMTMTTPACPSAPQIVREVREVIEDLGEEVGQIDVEVVLSPPWTPDRMTEEARDELGMF